MKKPNFQSGLSILKDFKLKHNPSSTLLIVSKSQQRKDVNKIGSYRKAFQNADKPAQSYWVTAGVQSQKFKLKSHRAILDSLGVKTDTSYLNVNAHAQTSVNPDELSKIQFSERFSKMYEKPPPSMEESPVRLSNGETPPKELRLAIHCSYH